VSINIQSEFHWFMSFHSTDFVLCNHSFQVIFF
jgi:hypothetical protein